MEKIRVRTWDECEQRLHEIEQENAKSLTGVWFRGVCNASWSLTTTLERRNPVPFFVADYWDLMRRIKTEVEAFTGSAWEVPEWSEPDADFCDAFRGNPAFAFMAHLRHHGFPSPLLDWSRSPYVAAYFAFAKALPRFKSSHQDAVAIYVFSETPNNIMSTPGAGPKICSHGGFNLKTHQRHFRQQSSYTVCVERETTTSRWRFASHERVTQLSDGTQDRLYKISVPLTERNKALKHFGRFNLNEFSLFGSEESLMETMAFREIDLKCRQSAGG